MLFEAFITDLKLTLKTYMGYAKKTKLETRKTKGNLVFPGGPNTIVLKSMWGRKTPTLIQPLVKVGDDGRMVTPGRQG